MKKTKIVATLGPATDSPEMIKQLIEEGVNVFRLNFSHGTHEDHIKNIETIKKVREELDLNIGIMADLQGPKIRVGVVDIDLVEGTEIVLVCGEAKDGEVPVQYEKLCEDVNKGDLLYLDDGLLELKVKSVKGKKIVTEVVTGGHLSSNKGINSSTASFSANALTEKDKKDAVVALDNQVDFIAVSFVRKAEDIFEIKKIIEKSKCPDTLVIAKIERHEAIDNLDEIIEATDIVMVARGDLGVETSSQKVPMLQKKMIRKCLAASKPVIVATQMLDSMIRNPRPTRAETSDIANAILDGADATMLSGETSVGKYPLEAVRTMCRIALDTEKWMEEEGFFIGKRINHHQEIVPEAIAHAAFELANITKAKYIVSATATGNSARVISRYRPHAEIISVSHSRGVARQLSLSWGIFPTVFEYETHRELVAKINDWLLEMGLIEKGENIIATSGYVKGEAGGTNIVRVHTIN